MDKFKIPSFIGIPPEMFEAVSEYLGAIGSRISIIFATVILINFLIKFLSDSSRGELNVLKYIITLFWFVCALFFMRNYKNILVFIENFIRSAFVVESSLKKELVTQAKTAYSKSYFSLFQQVCSWLCNGFQVSVVLFTHKGLIRFMYYLRSVLLMVYMHFGPISLLISFFPGPFKGTFKSWVKIYFTTSCWAITLSILEYITVAFHAKCMQAVNVSNMSNMGSMGGKGSISYGLLSIVLIFVILLAPAITSKIIGGVTSPNLGGAIFSGISMAAGPVAAVGGRVAGAASSWMSKSAESMKELNKKFTK